MQTRSGRFSIMFVVFTALFCFGLYSTARSILLQPISEDFSVSYTGSGLMFLISFLSVLLTNLAAGRLMQRFGMRVVYVASIAGISLVLLVQSLAGDYLLFLASTFVLTLFTSGQNLAGNSIVATAFAGDGGARLNLMHVFYGLGSLAAPLFVALLASGGEPSVPHQLCAAALQPEGASGGLDWRGIFVVLAILFGSVLFWYPFYRFRMQESAAVATGGAGFRHALADRHLLKITLAVLFAAGYEVSVSSWLVYTLEQGAGVSPAQAGLAIAVFFAGLAAGRASGSWLAKTGRLDSLLYPLAIVQALLAVSSLLLLEALPGLFALAGLTSSIFFPTLFYKVAQECHSSAAGAVYLTGAGLGVALFPFLVGVAGDLIGIRWALVAAVICAIMLVPAIRSVLGNRSQSTGGAA